MYKVVLCEDGALKLETENRAEAYEFSRKLKEETGKEYLVYEDSSPDVTLTILKKMCEDTTCNSCPFEMHKVFNLPLRDFMECSILQCTDTYIYENLKDMGYVH